MQDHSGFAPPGPGVWELESTHMVRPISRMIEDIFPAAATEGFRWSMARYGMLLEVMEFQVVNRFVYICARGVGAPPKATAPPPRWIFKLLTKLHPEMRRRIATVREVFATKRWREDVERWDTDWKPAAAREYSTLQQVNLSELSDEQLLAHLQNCLEAVARSVTLHHSLNATAMLPLGDFLAHTSEWTGMPPSELLPLFRGASRVSLGANEELESLARTLADHPDALTLLASSDARAIVDALSARADAAGSAFRRYVDMAGVRLATGYDVADMTLLEMPELLVETIRAKVAGHDTRCANDVEERERSIRERVPPQHRAAFDELLTEARLTYRIRDERAYGNDAWALGVARRAVLEAGRRLRERNLLHDAGHAVDLTLAEVRTLLRDGRGPSADEVASHVRDRTTKTTASAPPFLGGVPSGPPSAEWLPPDAARAERAIGVVLREMFARRDTQQSSACVNGFAASPGEFTGIARLVLDPQDMNRVQQGDVLITRATSPAFNALLPLIGGVVTDRGGTLSHAAVVAREYGIPAVVGTGNATELIRDGARVRLDGAKGTVEVLV